MLGSSTVLHSLKQELRDCAIVIKLHRCCCYGVLIRVTILYTPKQGLLSLQSDAQSSGHGAVYSHLDSSGGLGNGALGGRAQQLRGGGLVGADGALVQVGEQHGLGNGNILHVRMTSMRVSPHRLHPSKHRAQPLRRNGWPFPVEYQRTQLREYMVSNRKTYCDVAGLGD
jgi:hypothetical protein